MKTKTKFFIVLGVLFVFSFTVTDIVFNTAKAENTLTPTSIFTAKRAGGSKYYLQHLFTNVTTCVDDPGGTANVELLIPWDVMFTISCNGPVIICRSMVDETDFSIDSTTGLITDANGDDGAGNCFRLETGGSKDEYNWSRHFNPGSIGRREGVCDGAQTGHPCRVLADCDATGTTACTDTSGNIQSDGIFICGERAVDATADVRCGIWVED